MNDKKLADQIGNKCRHFNGVQNEECKAGIRYESVRNRLLGINGLPCFKDNGCTERCAAVSFPSEQEATEKAIEQEAAITVFLKELNEGKTCPHCHAVIEKRYQVACCVYAKPCHHRQYHGQLPESERTPKDTREIDEQASLWGEF